MYLKTITKISLISISVAICLLQTSIAQAQQSSHGSPSTTTPGLSTPNSSSNQTPQSVPISPPSIVAPTPPQVQSSPTAPPATSPAQSTPPPPDSNPVATASLIKVGCDGLQTVVQKGERQAFLFNWKTGYFGTEYTPETRCQIVSQRLQAATDRNGGTLKGLQLESGRLNGQMVICVLQSGENGCTNRNLLFTLNPENAKQPQAVIAKILTFASSGSARIDESAKRPSPVNPDLGSWERQAFPDSEKSPPQTKGANPGF